MMENFDTELLSMLVYAVVFSIIVNSTSSSPHNDQPFATIVNMQQEMCPLTNTSSMPKCCGFCSMGGLCKTTKSCCPQYYDNFQQVLYSRNRRFVCDIPEFTPETIKEENYHWRPGYVKAVKMGNQCNCESEEVESVSYITKQFCENPLLAHDLYKILPVDVLRPNESPTTYLNRFCAQCSEPTSFYVSWDIDVRCKKALMFSEIVEDMLSVAERADCNLFFKPPYPKEEQLWCRIPPFRISECNVTGLWAEFNSSIEDACNSFLDPFNKTYKNYFCYLCNTNNQVPFKELSCMDPFLNQEEKEAPFSYFMGPETVRQIQGQRLLKCNNETQFEDTKLMVCRDLRCENLLYHENCMPKMETVVDNCLVVFIKLTFGIRQIIYDSEITHSSFLNAVTYTLREYVGWEQQHGMDLYKKVSVQNGYMVVDYVIVRLNFNFNTYSQLRERSVLNQMHGKACYVGNPSETTAYIRVPLCEFATYEYSSSTRQPLRVPKSRELSVDILQPFRRVPPDIASGLCDGKTRIISKLDYCIHIELKFTELPMKLKNSFLIIVGSSREFVFSQWEYRTRDENVAICLEDYLLVYKNLATKTSGSGQMSYQTDFKYYKQVIAFAFTQITMRFTEMLTYR